MRAQARSRRTLYRSTMAPTPPTPPTPPTTQVQKKKRKKRPGGANRRHNMPVPLAPPPTMRSRKRARVATTLFHKYTSLRDAAIEAGDGDEAAKWEQSIERMGGREEYQRASQLNTSLFSTSRWVLGVLGRMGWLQGIPVEEEVAAAAVKEELDCTSDGSKEEKRKKKKKRKLLRRNVRLMEVGAINLDLINAASRTKRSAQLKEKEGKEEPLYRLNVRAIDLRSTHPAIEEADFLRLPLDHPSDPFLRFDVLVCSMVLNCVTSPSDRGRMLCLLYHQLRPGGLCFLTVPRLCLVQSKYTSVSLFRRLLMERGVGFDIVEEKESPKVAFFVLRRPDFTAARVSVDPSFTRIDVVNLGRKFRNTFAVSLDEGEVMGHDF